MHVSAQRDSKNSGFVYLISREKGGRREGFCEKPLGKINWSPGERMGDKKVCDNVCLCRRECCFRLLHGLETSPERELLVGCLLSFSWE